MRQEKRPAVTTTLYDLISALHLGVEDDQMITAIVTYLLRTGQLRFVETLPADHDRTRQHEDWHLNDAFVLPARRTFQPTLSIDLWEQTSVGSGFAEGACDGRT